MKIDETDLNILHYLQLDARISMRELAKRVNLSAPSVAERVRKLEDSGIIEGYSIKINKEKLGMTIKCLVEITLKNFNYELAPSFIVDYPKCEACFRLSGDSCFLAVFSVSSIKEVEDFVMMVSPYATTRTKFAFAQLEIDDDIRKYFK